MLGDSGLGIQVNALVLSKAEPENRKGIGKNGKPYDFWTRNTQLFAGPVAGTIAIDEMGDSKDDFAILPPLASIYTFVPKKAEMRDGLLTFTLR